MLGRLDTHSVAGAGDESWGKETKRGIKCGFARELEGGSPKQAAVWRTGRANGPKPVHGKFQFPPPRPDALLPLPLPLPVTATTTSTTSSSTTTPAHSPPFP